LQNHQENVVFVDRLTNRGIKLVQGKPGASIPNTNLVKGALRCHDQALQIHSILEGYDWKTRANSSEGRINKLLWRFRRFHTKMTVDLQRGDRRIL
jgi:hypothetical protein